MSDKLPQFDRNRHGSLYDRGSADSYYGRPADPHWYPNGTPHEPRIEKLTAAEMVEYMQGFADNEEARNFKDWG